MSVRPVLHALPCLQAGWHWCQEDAEHAWWHAPSAMAVAPHRRPVQVFSPEVPPFVNVDTSPPTEVTVGTRPVTAWTWESSTAVPQVSSLPSRSTPLRTVPHPCPPGLPSPSTGTQMVEAGNSRSRESKSISGQVTPSVRTDVKSLAMAVDNNMTVRDMWKRLAEILTCSVDRLSLQMSGCDDDRPDWVKVPDELQVMDAWRPSAQYDTLEVVVDTACAFNVKISSEASYEDVQASHCRHCWSSSQQDVIMNMHRFLTVGLPRLKKNIS